MSQSNTVPADTDLIPATNPAQSQSLFFTVAQLRAAMSPIGYMTPADQINAAAAAAAQATANAAIPSATLGQPNGTAPLDGSGKVPLANIPASVLGSSHYLGTWNASTNTPLITSSTAPSVSSPVGAYYIVSVAGTPTINGVSVWHAGDWIIWNGSIWSNLSGQLNPVSSVAGLQGAISTAQLATALAGSVALSSAAGTLNVVLGTAANTAAAGNDSRIIGAAQNTNVFGYVANVAAIGSYTGNSPSLQTAGYYAAGDGGGATYSQTNTGAQAIVDGSGRNWYLQDVAGREVNILHFGAKPDGVTDMQPAWAAADSYAAANNKGVFVPSAPTGASWKLITPMVTTARSLRFEAPYSPGTGGGTVVHFVPAAETDLVSAITLTGNGVVAYNVSVIGPDSLPSLANVMSSGWVIAASSFQGKISADGVSMIVASGLTGTPAVGQQVSGAGMNGVATITAVSGSTLTITPSQPQILTAQTFTTCNLPNYSAFKAGSVGIQVAAQGTLYNCTTFNVKVGIYLNNTGGHVDFYDCNPGGFFGYYVKDNSFDYAWYGKGPAAVWAGFAFGTSNPVGTVGGITGSWFRVQFPLEAAYHVYQFQDQTYSGAPIGIVGSFYACSFESCCEAMMQVLPASDSRVHLVGCFQQWDGSGKVLPTTITPTPRVNLLSLGTIQEFDADYNQSSGIGAWAADSTGNGYAQYSIAGTAAPLAFSKINLRCVPTPNLNTTSSSVGRWIGNDRSVDLANKGDFLASKDVKPSANLLRNPENAANWTSSAAGTTITVTPLSGLPELSGIVLPQAMVDMLGNNPNIVKIVPPAGLSNSFGLSIQPALAFPLAIGPLRLIWFNFWTLSLATGTLGYFLKAPTSFLYSETASFSSSSINAWRRIAGVNQGFADVGDVSGNFSSLGLTSSNAAGTFENVIYLAGVMVGLDEVVPYTTDPCPGTQTPFSLGQYAVASLPAASLFRTGTNAFATNGRNPLELLGTGSGCPVFVKIVSGSNQWCAVWSGTAVAA